MIRAGVIGYPVHHSKSPAIHGYWIKKHNLSGEYKAIAILPGELEKHVQHLVQQGYAGFNVTIPHKVDIQTLCSTVDATARAIGAVNTVVIRDGKLSGMNTDAYGFIQNIKQDAPFFDFKAGPAVVLGAGGAARAIIHGLLKEGVLEILLTNRTREKAEALRDIPGASNMMIMDWDDRNDILREANLLVNTTALGMAGQEKLDIDLKALPRTALVNDIVYAPLMTPLLAQAKNKGNPFVTGIGMLLHQARPAFQAWFGVLPEVDEELRKLVQG